MPSDHAIAFIKKIEAEPDREVRRAMIREEYERIGREGDALVLTMGNVGMGTDEIYRAFETEAVTGIKRMFGRGRHGRGKKVRRRSRSF